MSLIINLSMDEEEIPVEVLPSEDFTAVLQKASILVGYEIDLSSLVGEDIVNMTDSVYEYFMKQETLLTPENQLDDESTVMECLDDDAETLNEFSDQNTTIVVDENENDSENVIKIIELSENEDSEGMEIKPIIKSEILDYFPTLNDENAFLSAVSQFEEYFSNEKVPNVNKIIETIVKNRVTCHFCNIRVSNMKDPKRNYMFEEKNQVYFNNNLKGGINMNAKLICSKCLGNNFTKLGKSPDKNLAIDESIVVSDGLKLIYKALPDEETFKNRRKSKIIVRQDPNDQFIDDGDYCDKNNSTSKKKKGRKRVTDTIKDNTNFVVRRKLTADANNPDTAENKSSPVIKRKLEMDGTISEICISAEGSNVDEVCAQSKKISKISSDNELICRSCGLQFDNLSSVVDHGRVHQVNNRINAIPCGLCLRSFKSTSILKRHVFGEHQLSQNDSTKLAQTKEQLKRILEGDYDEKDSTLVEIKPEIVPRDSKKEETSEENEEEDLTDRLHKYLSGEMDADTFFQQEYYKSDPDSQIIPDEDDDDLEVWIIQAENPDDIEDKDEDSIYVEELTVAAEDEPEEDDDELAFLNATENTTENVDTTNIVEDFQEVDYFEDPEYDPEDNDDNGSVKSTSEKKIKKRWSTQAKHKCEVCNKSYTSQLRLEQHKCHPSGNPDDKKDDLTCPICKETFLSKVRLQFHRQTHREGGWQHMSCDQCGRRDFASEHELFDHVYFSHSKPFACPFDGCIKTFKLKKLLKTHIRDHGIKKYVCNICNQRFQVHQTLKEHMVLHLKVKPYQCHICHKYMSKASRLRMHLLVHTSQQNPSHILVCKICDGAFKDVPEAEAHCDNVHDCEPREDDKDGVYDEDMYEEMGIQILSPTRFYNEDDDTKSGWRKSLDVGLKKENLDSIEIQEGNNDGPTLSNKHGILMQLSDVARKTITAVWIDKVFSCQYCEKVYYTKEALHQHRFMHSEVPEPYQCHLCEARFVSYARCTAHKSTHGYFKEGGAPSLRDFPVVKHYLCDLCDKSNLLWTTVSVHFRHHHKYNVNRRLPPPCKNCCTQYNTSWELGKHRRMKHRKDVHAAAKAPIKVVNYSYKCMECDQQLPNRAALTSHRKALHGDDEPGRKSNKNSLLVCSECGKTYATKPALLTHIKWHTEHGVGIEAARRRKRAFGKGNHICSTCGLGFYSAANLRAHIDRIHEKSYKYTCEECGKGHFTHVEMETHKLTHTGERPFKCPDCPRAYVTKAILNKHYRNHTGERPYSCELCGATFKTAHSRNYHKMKHENGKLPAPLIVLEVKGGNSKTLQAALHESFQVMGDKKEGRSIKHYSEDGDSIKEEIEEFHQEVNEEEVLIRTSEMDDSDDNIITVQEESPDGVHIVYKRIVRGLDENGCENEYTIEYEEVQ